MNIHNDMDINIHIDINMNSNVNQLMNCGDKSVHLAAAQIRRLNYDMLSWTVTVFVETDNIC